MGKNEVAPCRRYLDMWALPGIHPSNVEILQKMTTADTNHFTTHMDTVGTVAEQNSQSGDWDTTHIVGLRTDAWKIAGDERERALQALRDQRRRELKKDIRRSGRLNAKQREILDEQMAQDKVMSLEADEIEKRRLVLKLFKTNTERVRWCGTIEQVTMTEVHNSIGSKRNLLTMVVMLPRSQRMTYVQQNHRTFRIPSIFTFGFYDGAHVRHVSVTQRWVSIGGDFDIEVDGQKAGVIDGRLFSFGADSYLNIVPGELTQDTQFVDLLTLFTASVGYHKAMRKSLDRRVEATLSGKSRLQMIDHEELRLRHNGRAAA